ncbi:hypothetical protein [Acinetobacter sp. CIP 102129]|uniref:hypothetical protein n=1 Tax=Acinetobacter sp. CIP 102129 TaxID=1144664 RepID=UPI0002CEE33C|nr:hypothetical protein [Acinetobacter sp. CIP 102129]ENU87408.1 hypothetical protein F973_00328 [Acinetobacter sp. CIP 102129]
MNQISTVAQGVIVAIGTGFNVYATVANAMDAVENQGVLTGNQKKEAVIAFVKGFVENWDEWKPLVSIFIDQLKAAYNAVKVLFK